MKRVILTTMAMACAVGAFAQGTVTFNNRVTGSIVTHIYSGGNSQLRGNGTNDTPAGGQVWSAPYILVGTVGGLASSTTFAALLGAPGSGQPADSLQVGSSGAVTTFRTGAAAGFIAPTTATFNNIQADAPVGTFQVVAWDNSSGQYSTWALAKAAWNNNLIQAGTSAPFDVTQVGGGVNTPPNLLGLTSFNIYLIPEPGTMALAGLGAAALLIFRRRK